MNTLNIAQEIYMGLACLIGLAVCILVYVQLKKAQTHIDGTAETPDEQVAQNADWDGAQYRNTASWSKDNKNPRCC